MKSPKSPQKKNAASSPDQWVDLHGNYLYRFALSRLRNRELAENAVQETLLSALTARKKFCGRSSERTWLIGILKHKIIDHYRKKYREISVTDLVPEDQDAVESFYDVAGKPNKYPSEWEADPRQLSSNNEFWRILEDCLKKLPKATADAFSMREMDKIDTKEICKILGISATNLWVMLHRARLQLRGCLENNWFEKKAA